MEAINADPYSGPFKKDCRIYQNGTTQHMNHTHVSPVHKKARPCQAAGIFPTRNPYNNTYGQKQGKNYVVSFMTAFLKMKFAHTDRQGKNVCLTCQNARLCPICTA